MAKINVYFNENNGYIIVPYGRAKAAAFWIAVHPYIELKCTATPDELAEAIYKAIKISEESKEVDPKIKYDKNFWEIPGSKSFSVFCKKYKAVDILCVEDRVDLCKLLRDEHGSYMYSTQHKDMICLGADCSVNHIAKSVVDLLKANDEEINVSSKEFETLGLSKVRYCFENDYLEDCGDGGTDAYQIYKEPDSGEYIAFLIDNGYQSNEENAVRNVLERQFGIFKSFSYDDSSAGKISITATNSDCIIQSSLFFTTDDSFEFICYAKHLDSKILEIYDKIRSSIQVDWS